MAKMSRRVAFLLIGALFLSAIALIVPRSWRAGLDQALYDTVLRADEGAVKSLLDRGANPLSTKTNQWGYTTLFVAEGEANDPRNTSRRAIVRHLLDHCSPATNTPAGRNVWFAAARFGHTAQIQRLIREGANINATNDCIDYTLPQGSTALMYAAREDHPEAVRLLIRAGANIQAANRQGSTALTLAAAGPHGDVCNVLLAAGANCRAPQGADALWWAAERGATDLVLDLLARGASIDGRGGKMGDPLQAASSAGHTQTVTVLIRHGADVNHRGPDGRTPLAFMLWLQKIAQEASKSGYPTQSGIEKQRPTYTAIIAQLRAAGARQ